MLETVRETAREDNWERKLIKKMEGKCAIYIKITVIRKQNLSLFLVNLLIL